MTGVMQKFTSVPSFHEPQPWCVDDVVREVNSEYAPSQEVAAVLEEKLRQVALDSRRGLYFESNQMFIKSYYEQVFDTFDDVYGVYLWRNPIDTTISYFKKCRHRELGWFLESHWPKNIMRTEAPLSFYDNALWQSFEVRERWLKNRHRFVETFEFDFLKLNDADEWKRFFAKFKIQHKPFDQLPPVKRNESGVLLDDAEALALLRRSWNKSGEIDGATVREYIRRERFIEWGKRQIAHNRAEMNPCKT